MLKKITSFILWIIVFQFIGYWLGQMTQENFAWYQTLNKSTLTPPQIVFPIVWGILYTMLALAGYSLWQRRAETRAKLSLLIYTIQILMNWAWTPIFFQFHLIQAGFYWILVMALMTIFLIYITWKNLRFTSIILIPYCLWLLFACYLNWAIWIKN